MRIRREEDFPSMKLSALSALAAVLLAGNTFAAESFLGTHAPKFWHGGEFPGATGRVEVVQDELRLHYDFSGGGHYVAARFGLPERPKAKRIAFEANLPDSTEVTLRIVDSTGQTFQYGFSGSTDGDWEEFSFVTEGIGSRWGGANDGILHLPLVEFAVLAENRGGAKDVLRARNIRFFEHAERPQKAPELPFDKAAAEAGRLRDDLARALPSLEKQGLGAKTSASLAVMDYFYPWILEDIARGFTNRAVRETRELVMVGRDAKARLQAIAEGKVRDEPVPHFVTGPVETSHAQIVGTREWPDGRRERGNVMLTGFGHFGTVQREQEKLPPLGNHIIQMEIGPWSVLKDEHVVDTNGFVSFVRASMLGMQEDVQICLLLSPHYFPQWALKKWPHLSGCAGGFFKYCVHDEHAQGVIEKYLRTVIPLVRGFPTLHSICLSNEPEQGHFGPDCALRKKWPGWLERRHGTVAALNAKWGTSYASFADVPMPKDFRGNPATPATLDFVRFSRESFAAFHRRMADVIHELAPELPVHAKIMIFADFGNNATSYSVDPAAFAQLGAYNGNDAYVSYRGDQTRGDNTRGWVHDWWTMEAGYGTARLRGAVAERRPRTVRHDALGVGACVRRREERLQRAHPRTSRLPRRVGARVARPEPSCGRACADPEPGTDHSPPPFALVRNPRTARRVPLLLPGGELPRPAARRGDGGDACGIRADWRPGASARRGARRPPAARHASAGLGARRVEEAGGAGREGVRLPRQAGIRRLLPSAQRGRLPVSGRSVGEEPLAPVRRACRGVEPAGLPARTRRRFREGRLRRGVARLPHERRLARDIHQPPGEARARASGGARPRPPLRHRRSANP